LLLLATHRLRLFSIRRDRVLPVSDPIGLDAPARTEPCSQRRASIFPAVTVSPVGRGGLHDGGSRQWRILDLAPIYGQSLSFSTRDIALFMSVFIAGVRWCNGLWAAYPTARTALDHCRRLHGGVVLRPRAGVLGWLLVRVPNVFYAVVFALGAAMLPLYSLSIAHANDRLPRSDFVEASAAC
jgi:hypothetical protein